MAALNAHLLESGDHGRLGFHADCPVCRQGRLFGALSAEPVVSRRAQATLASGVLAFSTAAPGAALAQAPDQQQEGVVATPQPGDNAAPVQPGDNAAPVQPGVGGQQADGTAPTQPPGGTAEQPGAGVASPGVDPGGDTALPVEGEPAAPAPEAGGGQGGGSNAGDLVPPESGPVSAPDPSRPVTAPQTQTPETGAGTPVPPPESTPSPAEPRPAPGVVESPPVEGGAPRGPASSPPRPPSRRDSDRNEQRAEGPPRSTRSHEATGTPAPAGGTVGPSPGASAVVAPPTVVPAVQSSPPTGTGTLEAVTPAVDRFPAGVRAHVVEPGESLWSIAKRLLGTDASAARIARAVSYLWELNKDRIGTGDPDLLMVGTKLKLR